MWRRVHFRSIWLACGLGVALLWGLPGCRDGIVIEPAPTFPDSAIAIATATPTPQKSPSNTVEYVKQEVIDSGKYNNWVIPILIVLGVLMAFYQLLRKIAELTGSSADTR